MAPRNNWFKDGKNAIKRQLFKALSVSAAAGRELCLQPKLSTGHQNQKPPRGRMLDVKVRYFNPGLRPRRTKMEMPGWAGQPSPRADGSHEYAWHCAPFTEGAQYGIEIFYPYDNELRVSRKDGQFRFDGDFGPAPDG